MSKNLEDYYNKKRSVVESYQPRKILTHALEYVNNKNNALDIGAGILEDSKYLLSQGFDVTAVEESDLIMQDAELIKNDPTFHFINTSFQNAEILEDSFDLVYCYDVLPFILPADLPAFLEKIYTSLRSGGVFAGDFFAKNDQDATEYPDRSFVTLDEVKKALTSFEVLKLVELNHGGLMDTENKNIWHIINFIAKKP